MIQFTRAEQRTVLGQRQLFCRYKAVQKHATDTVHLRISIADLISRFQGSLAHENSEMGAHPEQQKHFRSMAVQEPSEDSVHCVPHWMGRFARRVNKCSTLTFSCLPPVFGQQHRAQPFSRAQECSFRIRASHLHMSGIFESAQSGEDAF